MAVAAGDDDLGGGVLDTCFAFMDKAHAPNATGCHDKRVLVHCSKGIVMRLRGGFIARNLSSSWGAVSLVCLPQASTVLQQL